MIMSMDQLTDAIDYYYHYHYQGTLGYSDLQKRGMAAGDMGEHLPDVDFGTGRE